MNNDVETKKVRKPLLGTVVRCSSSKTIKVMITTKKRHPLYVKTLKITSKFTVHDENEVAKVGDVVLIQSCKPRSKTKNWELVSVQN